MEDLTRLRERLEETGHLFREEMMGHLLIVHVLNLHDIHARDKTFTRLSEHISDLMCRFIDLLYKGEYRQHRDLQHYASLLCITPPTTCRRSAEKQAAYPPLTG